MRVFKAKYVKEITVIDPDTKGEVEMTIFKHENGGMFALDSSWILHEFDHDETPHLAPNPFDMTGESFVELYITF